MKNILKNTMLIVMLLCAVWTLDVFAADTREMSAENYVDPEGRQLVLYYNVMTMRKGAGTQLDAQIVSEKNNVSGKVVWSTEDDSIVKISEDGKLAALKEGRAVVTAALEGTPIKKECVIFVVKNPEVQISEEKLIMEKGDTVSLHASLTKDEYDNKEYNISWKSNNEDVAVVDKSGNVTIVGGGTVTIQAAIDGVAAVAECKITALKRGAALSYGAGSDQSVSVSSLRAETTEGSIVTDNAGNQYRRGEKIGDFVITGYCTKCNSCGPRTTSTGKTATAGITVAVKKGQIPLGTKLIIGDHVYVAQDVHGNNRYSKVIDVFFGTRHGSEPFLKNIPVYYAK